MFQPSPAARTTKRTSSKTAPATPKSPRNSLREAARHDAARSRELVEFAAEAVSKNIREMADDLTDDIDAKIRVLNRFLIAADGDLQLGLHEFRCAVIDLGDAMSCLRSAILGITVRGQTGHTD